LVWLKARGATSDYRLYDSVRGATKELYSNLSNAEATDSSGLTSFNSDGFSVGSGSGANDPAGGGYVAWCWKAGGSPVSNTVGSITSQVSANPTAGFSVVTWTGNGSAGATIGHGLGIKPSMIWIKSRSLSGSNWDVYHSAYGATKYTILNGTNNAASWSGYMNNTEPTSTRFSVGSDREVNESGKNYVAYCFAEIPNYSRFGTYIGDGQNNGPFIYLGFRPAWVMVKAVDIQRSWQVFDDTRLTYNPMNKPVEINTSGPEGQWSEHYDILSNGFTLRSAYDTMNGSGQKYMYMAMARHPFGGSNVYPANAR
jgi:hypothetical protein